jgi:mannose/fructose/N-acetylgalactosamine-specific phosphotransferase system component IIB
VLRQINEKQQLIICTDIVEAVSLIDKGFNVINVVNAHRFKIDWTKNIPSKKIILASDEAEIQKRIGSIFLKNGINIRISNYDKISNTSKKKLESVGELFKHNKKNTKDDLPFWKNSK